GSGVRWWLADGPWVPRLVSYSSVRRVPTLPDGQVTAVRVPSTSMSSRKYWLLAALVGVGLSAAIGYLLTIRAEQDQKIKALEDRLARLQRSPENSNGALDEARPIAPQQANTDHAATARRTPGSEPTSPDNLPGSLEVLKDLETVSNSDPRSSLEKLQEL